MTSAAPPASPLSLIPYPAKVETNAQGFALNDQTRIQVAPHDAQALFAARKLQSLLQTTPGLHLKIEEGFRHRHGVIRLARSPAAPDGLESYSLSSDKDGVQIKAKGEAGLYYGAITLWQLASAEQKKDGEIHVPGVRIEDAPRFGWRGLLLDSARHYQPPDIILHLIDHISELKLNVLHWHLTDDQCWRLQIPQYPRLTEVGAWRTEAGYFPQAPSGGFYTEDDVRRIVAYAHARHVRIVPEIDVPGHATAAIAAYPSLGAALQPPTAPSSDWGLFFNVYRPSSEWVDFLHTVLDEVMALFPDSFVHIGGDEVQTAQWKASPAVQARMKALGLKNEAELQSWFTHEATAYLAAHGRRAIGWDEILDVNPPKNAAIMSWRGFSGAIKAAKTGRDAILSPAPQLYFDNRQDDLPGEPTGRGLVVGLDAVYGVDLNAAQLSDEERAHILGLQANIWTEHLQTPDKVERAAFPRAAALAERAWTTNQSVDFTDFLHRLPDQSARFSAEGVIFYDTAFLPRAEVRRLDADRAQVTLSKPASIGQIHYRLDGEDPGLADPVYQAPLTLALPAKISMATFIGQRRVSDRVLSRIDGAALQARENHQLSLIQNALALNLQGAPRPDGHRPTYLVDILNPGWLWKGAWLNGMGGFSAEVEPLPFNFQLGELFPADPAANIQHLHPPVSDRGELQVRLDRCDGPVIANLSLNGALAPQTVQARLATPLEGLHDLCFTFTGTKREPLWVLGSVRLTP